MLSREEMGSVHGFVYAIWSGVVGDAIKVGYSKKPEERLKQIQTSSPALLSLIHQVPGDMELERDVHRTLGRYRQSGEWFLVDHEEAIRVLEASYASSLERLIREHSEIQLAPAPDVDVEEKKPHNFYYECTDVPYLEDPVISELDRYMCRNNQKIANVLARKWFLMCRLAESPVEFTAASLRTIRNCRLGVPNDPMITESHERSILRIPNELRPKVDVVFYHWFDASKQDVEETLLLILDSFEF